MNEYRKFRLGDRVKLDIPFTDRAGSNEIKRFNGNNFEVSKVTRLKLGYVYELKGVKSKMGIPFSFVSDWLVPLEVE